jgi:hypothetical protein
MLQSYRYIYKMYAWFHQLNIPTLIKFFTLVAIVILPRIVRYLKNLQAFFYIAHKLALFKSQHLSRVAEFEQGARAIMRLVIQMEPERYADPTLTAQAPGLLFIELFFSVAEPEPHNFFGA